MRMNSHFLRSVLVAVRQLLVDASHRHRASQHTADIEAATLLGDYEAKIVALERMVGR